MSKNQSISRRRFLKGAAGAMAAPLIVPASALGLGGVAAPSNRVRYGYIGCGLHGAGWNFDQIFRCDDAQIVAVCDVDEQRLDAARARVERHYRERLGRAYPGCAAYRDFRELIRRRDLDVVGIATPDHWHVIPAIMAVRTGKDVICEKPLTLTVTEGRILCDEVRRTNRIFQTASENRSIDSYIRCVELARNGRIGRLRHIRVTLPSGNESRGNNFTQRSERPVPEGFDYEMWLGQAPRRPYVPARCHGSFRWCLDYSGGRLTDWGAHIIDLAQWGNNSEATGPVEVEGSGRFPPRDSLFNTAESFDINYRYASGVTLNVSTSTPGIRFEGTEGWVGCTDGWRTPVTASNPAILEAVIGANGVHVYRPSEVIRRTDWYRGGEHRNFIDCVKSRRPCYAPAETGHRSITIAHIGNIAIQLGRRLRWNPDTERFINDREADAMLSRTQREPWTIANINRWL
jgi:predicted dehydrogenase